MSPDPVDPSLTIQALSEMLRSPILWGYVAGIATGWSFARRATRYMLGGRL